MAERKKDPRKQKNQIPPAESVDVEGPETKEDAEQTIRVPESSEQAAAGFPVVGIGASAGGLAAFEAFFAGMPTDSDPGMAFVLVQHLAPDHKSILADLIRRYTRMQVFEVEDGMRVLANCALHHPAGSRHGLFER